MRKFLTSFCAAVIALMPLVTTFATPVAANAATTGLIKGPGDTVYWKSTDGKRYVFPTYNTFRSWYGDVSQPIQMLTSDELGIIPIGGNVTYKPGVRLVKVTTDPKVYAVARYGMLRWITSESLAVQLYGADWARKVDDLPDPFFVNYNIGASINSTADYSPSGESAAVSTPDDSLKMPASPTSPTSAVTRFTNTVSLTSPKVGDNVVLTAILNINPTTPVITKIEIVDPRTNTAINTCYYQAGCVVAQTMAIVGGVTNIIFHVKGYDASNNLVADEWFPTVSISPAASTATPAPTITSPTANQVFTNYPRTLTVTWANDNQPKHNVEVACDVCVSTSNLYSNPTTYYSSGYSMWAAIPALAGDNTYRVRVQAVNSDNVAGTWSNYVYFSFRTAATGPVAPTITSPTASQIFTNYPRTMTVRWNSDGVLNHTVQVDCDYCGSYTQWSGTPSYYYATDGMNYVNVPALAGDNQFRVRVQAVQNGTASAWSNYVYFSFKTAATGPVAPTITSPTANQIFTNYPRTLTVTWANDNQPRHNIEVACDVCVSVANPYSGATTYNTSDYRMNYALAALAGDNTFRVRVQAIDSSNITGPWSNYVYFSFKTAPAASALQITGVQFQDATVNDNLGAKVGLTFNHQPQKIEFSFTSPTGQKILNGYTNMTKSSVMPFSDNYVMLMNNLASNVDYQYLVTATDWDGTKATAQGIYHSPTLSQPYAYLDYQVVGTSQQGQIVVSPSTAGCNSSKCGYNFVSRSYSGYSGGAFYSNYSNGTYQIFGNNVGQGGLAPLINGDVTVPLVSSGLYNRYGVPFTTGAWYAIYDEANQQFIKIRVAKLVTP